VPTPAGVSAVIELEELTVKPIALLEPNATAVTPEKFEPEIVTVVAPAEDPLLGLTLVIAGGVP